MTEELLTAFVFVFLFAPNIVEQFVFVLRLGLLTD